MSARCKSRRVRVDVAPALLKARLPLDRRRRRGLDRLVVKVERGHPGQSRITCRRNLIRKQPAFCIRRIVDTKASRCRGGRSTMEVREKAVLRCWLRRRRRRRRRRRWLCLPNGLLHLGLWCGDVYDQCTGLWQRKVPANGRGHWLRKRLDPFRPHGDILLEEPLADLPHLCIRIGRTASYRRLYIRHPPRQPIPVCALEHRHQRACCDRTQSLAFIPHRLSQQRHYADGSAVLDDEMQRLFRPLDRHLVRARADLQQRRYKHAY